MIVCGRVTEIHPHAFGMEMNGRKWQGTANNFRYSHNGHEKQEEVFVGAQSAEFWMYDSRIGRRWEIDPVIKPWRSPYDAFNNNSIWRMDPAGNDDYYSKAGTYLGTVGTGTQKRIIDIFTYKDLEAGKKTASDFESESRILTVESASQQKYLQNVANTTENSNPIRESGGYVVLDLSNEELPTLKFHDNDAPATDISKSHKTATRQISGEQVKNPIDKNGVVEKDLIIVGEVHGHSSKDSKGNKVIPGVSVQTNSDGGNDATVAHDLNVPVYAVDQKAIHKVDSKGKVTNNMPTSTDVLNDAIETKGGKK